MERWATCHTTLTLKEQEDSGFRGMLSKAFEDVAALASRDCLLEQCQKSTEASEDVSQKVQEDCGFRGMLSQASEDVASEVVAALSSRICLLEQCQKATEASEDVAAKKASENVAALSSRVCILEQCQKVTAELTQRLEQDEARGAEPPAQITPEILDRLTTAEQSLAAIQADLGRVCYKCSHLSQMICDVVNDRNDLGTRMSDLYNNGQGDAGLPCDAVEYVPESIGQHAGSIPVGMGHQNWNRSRPFASPFLQTQRTLAAGAVADTAADIAAVAI